MTDKLLKVIHDSAKGLRKAGVIDVQTMRKFDAACLPPIKTYTPKEIKSMRQNYHVSQAVFAAYLNTTPSTIQKWERGDKQPNGSSLKLLNLVERKGLEVLV
jgi:putative transcriptional regulator